MIRIFMLISMFIINLNNAMIVDFNEKQYQHPLNIAILQQSITTDLCSTKLGNVYKLTKSEQEYLNYPGVLTLFRDGDDRFYCETNCPLGMKAGCNIDEEDQSMDYNCERELLCVEPLPYLFWKVYTNSRRKDEIDISKTCLTDSNCEPGYYCSRIYHSRTQQRELGARICMEYPTAKSQQYGEMKVCVEDKDCDKFGIIATCYILSTQEAYIPSKSDVGFCHWKQDICLIGKLHSPVTNCTKSQDCNESKEYEKWCDRGANVCCKEDPETMSEMHYCPDGLTPFQQEPACIDNKCISKNGAGIEQGICWSNRCCPEFQKTEEGKYDIGFYSYQSNMFCDPSEPLPSKYVYKWCEISTNQIYTIGNHDYKNEKVRSARRNCKTVYDCDPQIHICLNLVDDRRVCYFHPDRPVAGVWKKIFVARLLGPLIIVIIFAIYVEYWW